jgi:hypothetical protein
MRHDRDAGLCDDGAWRVSARQRSRVGGSSLAHPDEVWHDQRQDEPDDDRANSKIIISRLAPNIARPSSLP